MRIELKGQSYIVKYFFYKSEKLLKITTKINAVFSQLTLAVGNNALKGC